MSTANRYPGTCTECDAKVPALAGVLGRKVRKRFTVKCRACAGLPAEEAPPDWPEASRGFSGDGAWNDPDVGDPDVLAIVPPSIRHADGRRSITTYFPSSGAVVFQNVRGRCIDAGCCGCCTY